MYVSLFCLIFFIKIITNKEVEKVGKEGRGGVVEIKYEMGVCFWPGFRCITSFRVEGQTLSVKQLRSTLFACGY